MLTLKKFAQEHGSKPFALIDRKYLERLFASAPTPGIARTCLITVRPFMQWAVTENLIEVDPTLGMKIKLPKSDGHDTWSEEQIAQFEARWPIGTMERLALMLLTDTPASQRRHPYGSPAYPRRRLEDQAEQEDQSRPNGSRNSGAPRADNSDQ